MKNKNNKKIYYQNIQFKKGKEGLITLEQLSVITGTEPRLIKKLVDHELLDAQHDKEDEIKVRVEAIDSIKKMLRLHYDLGIGWTSMPVVLDLLDRIEKLEKEIRELKE